MYIRDSFHSDFMFMYLSVAVLCVCSSVYLPVVVICLHNIISVSLPVADCVSPRLLSVATICLRISVPVAIIYSCISVFLPVAVLCSCISVYLPVAV